MNTAKLKGRAVVSLAEGAKLGQVNAPLFDPATLQLRAFQVKGDGQTFIVPLDLVRTIGTDAVTVESSQATQTASKGGEFGQLAEFSTLKQLKVVDAAGAFVGNLHDLEWTQPRAGPSASSSTRAGCWASVARRRRSRRRRFGASAATSSRSPRGGDTHSVARMSPRCSNAPLGSGVGRVRIQNWAGQ